MQPAPVSRRLLLLLLLLFLHLTLVAAVTPAQLSTSSIMSICACWLLFGGAPAG
jgi:multisubunit Na+/H+ antiporter MnhE subunit